VAGAAALASVLVAGGWWAGHATLTPSISANEAASPPVVVAVTQETVGRSLSLTVTVEQPFVPVAVNGLAGTVTSVSGTNRVKVGGVIYAVDTVPVRAVVGTLPFYRSLAAGDKGDDVLQLQRALLAMRFYNGVPSGSFDYWTVSAVRSWQRKLKIPTTGEVRFGELVAVPRLPSALRLGDPIVKGGRLGGGEPAVSAPTGKVNFQLIVAKAQAALIPPKANVVVNHAGGSWRAVVGDSTIGSDDAVRFTLVAPNGGSVCANACGSLPARERTSLSAKVVVVPEVSGPAVPVAAIHAGPDGASYVLLADGARRPVTVRGSAGGVVVVDGLSLGEKVLVLAGSGPSSGLGQ